MHGAVRQKLQKACTAGSAASRRICRALIAHWQRLPSGVTPCVALQRSTVRSTDTSLRTDSATL